MTGTPESEPVDEVDIGTAFRLADKRKPAPFATCPADGEPLIGTFRYRGAEFVCMACGAKLGFLSPAPAEPTPALEARHAELRARFDAGEEPGRG